MRFLTIEAEDLEWLLDEVRVEGRPRDVIRLRLLSRLSWAEIGRRLELPDWELEKTARKIVAKFAIFEWQTEQLATATAVLAVMKPPRSTGMSPQLGEPRYPGDTPQPVSLHPVLVAPRDLLGVMPETRHWSYNPTALRRLTEPESCGVGG